MKGRHFVLALFDYLIGKGNRAALETVKTFISSNTQVEAVGSGNAGVPAISNETPASATQAQAVVDDWAVPYMNVLHLQPILEAFDDDATGFVSVKEANEFTSSRPEDWRYAPARLYCY